MAKKLRRETIIWRDAWSGYDSPTNPQDVVPGFFLASSGWWVREDRDEVVLALETNCASTDDRVRHLQGILKKNIVSRRSSVVSIPDPGRKYGR